MKLILGSGSEWRKLILEKAGYKFNIMTADIDEKAIRSDDYEKLPLLIAQSKANVLLPQIREPAILITSDQIVVCDGQLREKPSGREEAESFLKDYSTGRAGQTNTAVVIINTKNGKQAEGVDIAKAYFRKIPDKVVEQYIENGDPMRCAGGFNIDSPILAPYIAKIEGDADSIQGLPMKLVKKLIKEIL